MPRKAKENKEKELVKEDVKTKTAKKTTKATTPDKAAKTAAKRATAKKSSKVTSSTEKKTTKKADTKSAKKTTTRKKSVETKNAVIEYYDLPIKYDQTVVKILAQTPKALFIYWEISDEDINNYKKQFGEDFFEKTKPILIIHNDTLNYSYEVKINDFANSWYLHINDSKSNYRIELARCFFEHNNNVSQINHDYIYITSSNQIVSPNDHILFNTFLDKVYFRNVKTNQQFSKDLSTLSFIKNMGKLYNIYDLYKKLFKNDNIDDLSNPSSRFLI